MVSVGRLNVKVGILKSVLIARSQTKLHDFLFIKFQKGQNQQVSGLPVARPPSGAD